MSQHAYVELSTDAWWTADEATQRVMWFRDFLRLATDQSMALTGLTGYSRDVTESYQGVGAGESELETVFHRHRTLLSVVSQQVEIGEASPFELKDQTSVRSDIDGPQRMPTAFSMDAASVQSGYGDVLGLRGASGRSERRNGGKTAIRDVVCAGPFAQGIPNAVENSSVASWGESSLSRHVQS